MAGAWFPRVALVCGKNAHNKMALSSETRVTWRLDDATLACEEILAALAVN
jgi:hypothetical protein